MSSTSKIMKRADTAWSVSKGLFLVACLSFSANILADDEKVMTQGRTAYESVCLYCHAVEVGVGPELKGRQLPAEYFFAIARSGFRAMPAFPQTHIDDETLKSIAYYLSKAPAENTAASLDK